MNLISCGFCGIVLDTNRIKFDDEVFDLEPGDELYDKFYAWDHYEEEMSLIITCPCCESRLLLNNGDKI